MNIVLTGRGVNAHGVFTVRTGWVSECERVGIYVRDNIDTSTHYLVASRDDTRKAQTARRLGVAVIGYPELVVIMDQARRQRSTNNAIEDALGETQEQVRARAMGRAARTPGGSPVRGIDPETREANRLMGMTLEQREAERSTRRRSREEIQAAGRSMRPVGTVTGRWSSGSPAEPHTIPRPERERMDALRAAFPTRNLSELMAHASDCASLDGAASYDPRPCNCHLAVPEAVARLDGAYSTEWANLNGQTVKFCLGVTIVFRPGEIDNPWVMVRRNGTQLAYQSYKNAVDMVAEETGMDVEIVKEQWPWYELADGQGHRRPPAPEPENFTATAPPKARCWEI